METELDVQKIIKERYDYKKEIERLKEELKLTLKMQEDIYKFRGKFHFTPIEGKSGSEVFKDAVKAHNDEANYFYGEFGDAIRENELNIEGIKKKIRTIYCERIFNSRFNIKDGLTIAIFNLQEMIDLAKEKEFDHSGFYFTKESLNILLSDFKRCMVMLDGIHGPKKDKYPEFYIDPVYEDWKKGQNN